VSNRNKISNDQVDGKIDNPDELASLDPGELNRRAKADVSEKRRFAGK
jgi:hypothetical protein